MKINTDLFGGLFMILTALFFWPQMDKFTIYAKLFPRAIIVLLVAAGLGLIIKGIRKPNLSKLFVLESRKNTIMISIVVFVWILVLKRIGFVVTSVVSLSILLFILSDKKNIKNFLISFIIAGGQVGFLYIIFSKFLYVPFPKGIFF